MFKMFQAKEKKATKQAPILIQESKDGEWFEELDDADLFSVVGGASADLSARNRALLAFGFAQVCIDAANRGVV